MALNIPKPDGNVGVIVGRFQVHELHPGHRELLDWVSDNYPQMIVVLGSSPVAGSRDNPLPYAIRAEMIKEAYPYAIVTQANDCRDDESWSNNLDTAIRLCLLPNQSPGLFGSRDSFVPHYRGSYPTQELEVSSDLFWSGSAVRKAISESPLIHNSPQFRAGVIYGSTAVYPRCVPTVDVALFHDDTFTEMYLVRKHGERDWRLIGGYADPTSPSYEIDVIREIHEEAGDFEINRSGITYVASRNIDDWRYRRGTDKIRSVLFAAHRLWGSVKIQDTNEIADVCKFPLDGITLDMIVPEHRPWIESIYKHLQNKGDS